MNKRATLTVFVAWYLCRQGITRTSGIFSDNIFNRAGLHLFFGGYFTAAIKPQRPAMRRGAAARATFVRACISDAATSSLYRYSILSTTITRRLCRSRRLFRAFTQQAYGNVLYHHICDAAWPYRRRRQAAAYCRSRAHTYLVTYTSCFADAADVLCYGGRRAPLSVAYGAGVWRRLL